MKRLSICWIIGCLLGLVACRPEVPAQAEQGETDVFPDYREVTVPVNMAPPNFKLVDQQLQGITRLKTMNRELIIAADHGVSNHFEVLENKPSHLFVFLVRPAIRPSNPFPAG